jgi:nicotinamide mononucleotide transporter
MSIPELAEKIAAAAKQTSMVEYAAVACTLLYVILAAFEKAICWLFGIASSILYIYICFTAQLYLESILQVFYAAMGVYGWWQWSRGSYSHTSAIIEWKLSNHIITTLGGALFGILLGFVFSKYTSAALPYFDAQVTSFSLIATWMVSKKIIENWLYWIVINIAAVYLYHARELHLTSALYFLLAILAAAGYIKWRKELKALSA